MLYALWCLQDLERVEDLERRLDRVASANMTPFSDGGVKNLNEERSAVLAAMRRSPSVPRVELVNPAEFEAAAQRAFTALADAIRNDPRRIA